MEKNSTHASKGAARWFDHQILVVDSVEKAIANYQALGFQTTPRMFHSFGSSNSLVMFRGTFIELLGDLDKASGPITENVPPPGPSRIAYLSTDAHADFEELVARGIDMSPVIDFTRPVPMPGGREAMIDCSVTLADRFDYPLLSAFVSNQRRPEALWVPEWQHQPNGVRSIISVIARAEDPMAHREYFERFVNPTSCHSDTNGIIMVDVSGCRLEILSHADCQNRFWGIALPDNRSNAEVIGLSVWTDSLSLARQIVLRAGAQIVDRSPRSFLVSAEDAAGTILEFVGVD